MIQINQHMGGHKTHLGHHPMDSHHQRDTSHHPIGQHMSRQGSSHHSSNRHISNHNMVCQTMHSHNHPKSRCAGSGLHSASLVALFFSVASAVLLPVHSASVSSQKR